MKRYYVNDLSRLKDFGFLYKDGRHFYISKRATAMYTYDDNPRLVFMSLTHDCVAIICEMYKQGIITIFDDEDPPTYNMKVTEEEMSLIYKMRKEKLENEKT